MDQTNQFPPINTMPNSTPPVNGTPNSLPSTEKPKKFGPIIAILIVILIIVIVALFLLASRVTKNNQVIEFNPEVLEKTSTLTTEPNIQDQNIKIIPQEVAPITNTADDIDSLQADLDASINGIDAQSI